MTAIIIAAATGLTTGMIVAAVKSCRNAQRDQ